MTDDRPTTRRAWPGVVGLAAVAALGLAFLPALLPTGPSANLDAAGRSAPGGSAPARCLVFLGGLLTALTPCVYPLIPITVGVFGARPGVGRGKAVLLTSSYVVGMGVVFAALGVVAARTGRGLRAAARAPGGGHRPGGVPPRPRGEHVRRLRACAARGSRSG